MTRRLAIIAGSNSHAVGEHEFLAGAQLLARALEGVAGLSVEVSLADLPEADEALDSADAVVVYSDGAEHHPLIRDGRLARLRDRLAAGLGLGLIHWAVDLPAGPIAAEFMGWTGGVYEAGYSCNPIWEALFEDLREHEITRGLSPFDSTDEWYFNIRFGSDVSGLSPILVATPSDQVRAGPYVWPAGPYAHIQAAAGRPETLMWAVERPDGGRGFSLTGGHFHTGWANDSFRRATLNALVWVAGAEVPAAGVPLRPVDLALPTHPPGPA